MGLCGLSTLFLLSVAAVQIELPARLTPESMEAIEAQFPRDLRDPAWAEIAEGLAARPESDVVRFARAAAAVRQRAVWRGSDGIETLRALAAEAEALSSPRSKRLAAHLHLATGLGLISLSRHAEGREELTRTVDALRRLGDRPGLARALQWLATSLLSHSRQPHEALPVINELYLLAEVAGLDEYGDIAVRLQDLWRRRLEEVDDHFGRASRRLHAFTPAIGIPEDADLVAVVGDVLLMNGDTDDQAEAAKPEFLTFDGIFTRSLELPDDTLELRTSLVDAAGHLWAGTNRGLYQYDGGRFIHYVNPDLGEEQGNELAAALARNRGVERTTVPLLSNIVNEIEQGPDGRYYLATAKGLAIWDRTGGSWEQLTGKQAPFPSEIERVAPAPDGSLVVAWADGFSTRAPDGSWKRHAFEFTHRREGTRRKNWLVGLLIDSAGQPWVHGLGGAQALHHHEVVREVDWRLSDTTTTVNHVLRASDGTMWFATPTGICRQAGTTCELLGAQRWMQAPWSLDLLEWPAGNIWVSVYQGGLDRILPPYSRQITLVDGFEQPMISGVAAFEDRLYFAHPAGLTSYVPATGVFQNFVSAAEGVPEDLDLALRVAGGSVVLVGPGVADGKGVAVFDGRQATVLTPEDGLADEKLRGICEISDGILLVGSVRALRRVDVAARTASPAPIEPPDEIITDVVCAPGEPIWIRGHAGGLFRIDGDVRQRVDLGALGLRGELRQIIRSATAGLFLVGERNILRRRGDAFEEVALDAEAFDFRVRDVLEDPRGRLYFSTESGVFVTNGEDWMRIGTSDGLVSDTSFDLLFRDDELWVVGQGGVTAWRPPDLAPPETFLTIGERVQVRDPIWRPRLLSTSSGVPKPGRVLLRSLAGSFEVPQDAAGPFLPSVEPEPTEPEPGEACAPGSVERDPVPHRADSLRFRLSGVVPFASFAPDEMHYWIRLDGGSWKRAQREVTLHDVSDGTHLIEARATGPYLRRDPTPARYCAVVDEPIPPLVVLLPIGLVVILGGWQRRRLRVAGAWLRHARGYRPIDPSPFSPRQPARGSVFAGREEAVAELSAMAKTGGTVVALCGERGIGKRSLLVGLGDRLEGDGVLVIQRNLAMDAAGGSLSALVDHLTEDLGARLENGPYAEALRVTPPISVTPADRTGLAVTSAQVTLAPAGSITDESNAFRRLDATLERLSRVAPRLRVAFLLTDAQVLRLAVDADAVHGTYFFPFLRGLAQQRANVAVFLSLEGRWFDLARRFGELLSFATALPVVRLAPTAAATAFTLPLHGQALILPAAVDRLVDESGGHPYLVQLLGHQLVALLNEEQTNICTPALADDLARQLVDHPETGLANFWVDLTREEKLLVAAFCERLEGDDRATLDQVLSWLAEVGAKLLREESRRALLALRRSGIIEEDERGMRIRGRLFRRWVRARHSMASVLEESYDYVGQYRLLERIGAGGMGVVWKARDLVRGDTVAVKLLRPELSESRRNRRRFLREARLGKRLQHPNIVRIVDYGEQEGRLYLAMEYLEGESLTRWARRNRQAINAAEVVRIGSMIASALEAIHRAGVLHRDVKSDNVMVTARVAAGEVSVKLMDFGLAVGEDVSRMTHAGAVFGTVGYMSPEQALGEELDQRSDLYSLGVVLFELSCGRLPFEAADPTATLHAIVHDPVVSLAQKCPSAPPDLVAVVDSLLSREQADRPKSAAEVVAQLEALASSPTLAGTPLADVGAAAQAGSNASGGASDMISRTLVELRSESLLSLVSSRGSGVTPAGAGGAASRFSHSLTEASRLVTLHRVSAAVARGVERDELLRECLQHTMDGLVASRGLVALRTASGTLEFLAVENLDPDAVQELVERAVREEAGFMRVPEPFGEAGPCVCAPVFVGEKVLGAVFIERDGDGLPFDDQALELAASVGYLLGLACERDRLQRAVVDKARLAAIGNMLAAVAHDFKNPLTVISAYAELAIGNDDAESRLETLTTIQRNVGVMTEMIGDLLAFARGDTQLRPAVVNLETLATEIEERLRLRCESRKIGLRIVAADADATIDVSRARRIIINLAENAVAALRRGSTIEIVLEKVDGKVAIQVRDDGPGLPHGIRARMFQPFVTSGEGTGLGLAIVRRFVDDHSGTIAVQSAAGEGTTFTIELPELGL